MSQAENTPRIRVLRVIEYNYPSVERMEADMQQWRISAVGSYLAGETVIRSTIMNPHPFDAISEEPEAR